MKKIRILLTAFIIILCFSTYAQKGPLFESKIADFGDIQLEYLDFGGEGLPLIWIQDYHIYHDDTIAYRDDLQYYKNLSDQFRVLAPIRRSYGRSSDTKHGYDVPTQAEDVLRFLDFMGIDRAVFWGRTPGMEEVIWIAEHHPERAAGLIIWMGIPGEGCFTTDNPMLEEFNRNYGITACDLEERFLKVAGPRETYQPHYFSVKGKSIDVPLLHHVDLPLDTLRTNSMELRRVDRFESYGDRIGSPELLESEFCGNKEAQQYFTDLFSDKERVKEIRQAYMDCNNVQAAYEHLLEAFGDQYIRGSAYKPGGDYLEHVKVVEGETRRFMEELENEEQEK